MAILKKFMKEIKRNSNEDISDFVLAIIKENHANEDATPGSMIG